jgi:transcriptional regulator of acetoin/glycerol metabolism
MSVGSEREFSPAVEVISPRDPKEAWKALVAAHERFVVSGGREVDETVRDVIRSSWSRCLGLGIDPRMRRAPVCCEPKSLAELLQRSDLGQVGSRTLEDFSQVLAGTNHVAVLADADGRILYSVGHREVADALEEINFRPGGGWSQDLVGPNGVGTPLALGKPEVVFGPEHFCEGWQPWVCYGSPIRDPASGKVVGCVDVTGSALGGMQPRVFELTVSLARTIERGLVVPRVRRRSLVLDEFLKAVRRWPNDGILVVDEAKTIVEMNALAGAILGGVAHTLGELLQRRAPGLARVVDESWSRGEGVEVAVEPGATGAADRVLAHCSPLLADGRVVGALIVLRCASGWNAVVRSGGPSVRSELPKLPARRSETLFSFEDILGRSPRLLAELELARKAASTDKNVLVLGETGTGKEMVAQAIHSASARASGPFVAINCAAMPSELVDNELYGHQPGAFTGARSSGAAGKFEQAAGGTLFLDELTSLPLASQAKLLRAIETRTIVRLGCSTPRKVDVRIVAAANDEALRRSLENGTFRGDLYYRLNVFLVRLPPLRERGDDVVLLAEEFLSEECRRAGREPLRLSAEIVRWLGEYRWPGNVRELRNLCERWAHTVSGPTVHCSDIPEDKKAGSVCGRGAAPASSLEEARIRLIAEVFQETGGNVLETARRLRIARTTVYRNLRKAGLL